MPKIENLRYSSIFRISAYFGPKCRSFWFISFIFHRILALNYHKNNLLGLDLIPYRAFQPYKHSSEDSKLNCLKMQINNGLTAFCSISSIK